MFRIKKTLNSYEGQYILIYFLEKVAVSNIKLHQNANVF